MPTVIRVIGEWLALGVWIASAFAVLLLMPMLILRRTRKAAVLGLYGVTFVYGANLLFMSSVLTWVYFGIGVLIFGFLFLGIGPIPLGFIAAIIYSDWTAVWLLALFTALIVGIRLLCVWLVSKDDNDQDRRPGTPTLDAMTAEARAANEAARRAEALAVNDQNRDERQQ